MVTKDNIPLHLDITIGLQQSLIYENPHDPDQQHCSSCISKSETQTTKLAACQSKLTHQITNITSQETINLHT
jgi:hypothetical protein